MIDRLQSAWEAPRHTRAPDIKTEDAVTPGTVVAPKDEHVCRLQSSDIDRRSAAYGVVRSATPESHAGETTAAPDGHTRFTPSVRAEGSRVTLEYACGIGEYRSGAPGGKIFDRCCRCAAASFASRLVGDDDSHTHATNSEFSGARISTCRSRLQSHVADPDWPWSAVSGDRRRGPLPRDPAPGASSHRHISTQGSGLRAQGSGLRAHGLGLRAQGLRGLEP